MAPYCGESLRSELQSFHCTSRLLSPKIKEIMTAEMKLVLLILSFMFSLNIMLYTLTKCSAAVVFCLATNPCFSAAVGKLFIALESSGFH